MTKQYLGQHKCAVCSKLVRVYEWLPTTVLCAKHKRYVDGPGEAPVRKAAKASVEKSLAAEDEHRTHSETLTDRIEKLEAENARMRERMSDQEDGLRYGEKVCATLVSERDAARSQVKAWQAEEFARRTERDEARAEVERLREALRAIAAGFDPITGSVDDPSAKQVDGYYRGYAQAALEKGGK